MHFLPNWQGRENEKHELTEWLDGTNVNLIGIEGVTGIGKSTLANEVFLVKEEEFANTFWADATRRSSFNDWARDVLEAFEYQLPKKKESDEDEIDETGLIRTLIECLQRKKCLLVIDNLETLLNENREWHDTSYSKFFAKWRNCRGSIVLLTTQVIPNDLYRIEWQKLNGLEESEGAALLQEQGIQGTEEELKSFSKEVEGHPTILQFAADLLFYDYKNQPHIKNLPDNWIQSVKPDYRDDYTDKYFNLEAIIRDSFERLEENFKKLLPKLSVYHDPFNIEAAAYLMPAGSITEDDLKQLSRRPFLEQIDRKDAKENSLFQFKPLIKKFMKEELEKSIENKIATIRNAIRYYKEVSVPKEQWQDKDDIKGYIEIFYYYCELQRYAEAKKILEELEQFLRPRGYNSRLRDLYEVILKEWNLGADDERQTNDFTEINDLADINSKLGRSYHAIGDFKKAEELYKEARKLFEITNNEIGEAFSLQGLGKAYISLRKYSEALSCYEQSKDIFNKFNKLKKEKAYSLQGLGKTYHAKREYSEAIRCYKEALGIFEDIKILDQDPNSEAYSQNRNSKAYCFDRLALIYFDMEKYSEAIEAHQEALKIYEESSINERHNKGYSLDRLGRCYYKLGGFTQAINCHNKALNIFRDPQIKDWRGEAYSLHNLGDIYQSLEQYSQAMDYHNRSLTIFEEIDDRNGIAECYEGLGIVYRTIGEYEQAIKYHGKALTIFKDPLNLAKSFNSLADAYKANNQVNLATYKYEDDRVIYNYKESRKYYGKIGDKRNQVSLSNKLCNYLINDLAKHHEGHGGYDLAIKFYNKAIEEIKEYSKVIQEDLEQDIENKWIVVFDGLGNCHEALSNHQEAINYYKRARRIKRHLNNHHLPKVLDMLAYSLDKIGNNHREIGNKYGKINRQGAAIKYYKASLNIQEQIGNDYSPRLDGRAFTLTYLAEAYENLDKLREAIHYQEEAGRIFREIRNHIGEYNSSVKRFSLLNKLGKKYRDLQQYEQAIESYQNSLDIQRQIGRYNTDLANTLTCLAEAYEQLENISEAIRCLEEAVRVFRAIDNNIYEYDSSLKLVNLLNKSGEKCRNLQQYVQAIEYYQNSWEIQQRLDRYNPAIADTLIRLAEACEHSDNLPEAIHYLEEAVRVFQEIGDKQNEGRYLLNLANLLRQTGEIKQGFARGQQAMVVFLKTWNLPHKISNLLRPIQSRQLHPLLYFLLGIILVLVWWYFPNIFD